MFGLASSQRSCDSVFVYQLMHCCAQLMKLGCFDALSVYVSYS